MKELNTQDELFGYWNDAVGRANCHGLTVNEVIHQLFSIVMSVKDPGVCINVTTRKCKNGTVNLTNGVKVRILGRWYSFSYCRRAVEFTPYCNSTSDTITVPAKSILLREGSSSGRILWAFNNDTPYKKVKEILDSISDPPKCSICNK